MNNQEYEKAISFVIAICSNAANGKEQICLSDYCIDDVFIVSQKHMLSSLVGQMLERVGVSSPDFEKAIGIAQRRAIILEKEYKTLKKSFEQAGIWYMPMKGTVLKNYYPGFATREMCDCDILFDSTRSEDVREIMENTGFHTVRFGESNDDCYIKSKLASFEMHRALFGNHHKSELYRYYVNVKDRLVKDDDNSYGYHFAPEDFYIYMIAHEYKHYALGGTGLRSLLDTYIFLKSNTLDMSYISDEMKKLGLSEFEQLNRSVAMKVFNQDTLTEREQAVLDYVISSGTYGSTKNRVGNDVKKYGGKFGYLVHRIVGPVGKNDLLRDQYRKRYSVFFRYPILLPFLPFYRFFKALFTSPKRLFVEFKTLRKAK